MIHHTTISLAVAAFFAAAVTASAAPFERWFDHRLPDGRVVRIHGEGDEYGARFEDEAGRPLVYDGAAGRYEYAAVDPATGAFVASGVPLGADEIIVPLRVRDDRPDDQPVVIDARARPLGILQLQPELRLLFHGTILLFCFLIPDATENATGAKTRLRFPV